MKTTITEALQELKTLQARIGKKRELIYGILGRQERFRDPHEKDGGSRQIIVNERQSIADLEANIIAIRSAIQGANRATTIKLGDQARTIHDWLVWRRDVAPAQKQFLERLRTNVAAIRTQAQQKGFGINVGEQAKPDDVIINLDEYALAQELEKMEQILGDLDGQLSLKNATVTIEV